MHRGGSKRNSAQLRNRCALATLGAYHLPPLGAGFFMPEQPPGLADLEQVRR